MTVNTEETDAGKLVIEGNAVPVSNTTSSGSSVSDTFTADFMLTQTLNNYELIITPTSSITFTQLQKFLLGSAQGVETFSTGFFPDEAAFTAVDLTKFTINNPIINVITFPNPAYYLNGSVTPSSNSTDGSLKFLTANLGGYQNSFLYLEFPSGTLDLVTQDLLQSEDSTVNVEE